MNTIWGSTINRTILVALVAVSALLWPAAASASVEAPPGTHSFNGWSFNTEDARLRMTDAEGTSYAFTSGLHVRWSSYFRKFTSGGNSGAWWSYRGKVTNMDLGDGCAYVRHRRGEFEINDGYRVTCSYSARVARHVIDYRRAPAGQRCLKRGDVLHCSRFLSGRQTATFTYRTEQERKVRLIEQRGIVLECGAVHGGSLRSTGFPHKFVVFARDTASCDQAFSDRTSLENMVTWTASHDRVAPPHQTIGGDMDCFRIAGGTYLACTNGPRCVVLTDFSRGRFPVVWDGWRAWGAFAYAPYDLFANC